MERPDFRPWEQRSGCRDWWLYEMKFLWAVIGASMTVTQMGDGSPFIAVPRRFLQEELHLAARQGEKSPWYPLEVIESMEAYGG